MRYKIIVHTNASCESIKQIDETTFKVAVTKQPINNKANKEVEKILKKYFNKPIKIIKGHTSKNKIIEL